MGELPDIIASWNYHFGMASSKSRKREREGRPLPGASASVYKGGPRPPGGVAACKTHQTTWLLLLPAAMPWANAGQGGPASPPQRRANTEDDYHRFASWTAGAGVFCSCGLPGEPPAV